MSDIQTMNSDMLEILKNYLEIVSFFNEKLDEIKADEILNINLELLKASILDLNINIANFKSNLQYNEEKKNNLESYLEGNLEGNPEGNLEGNPEGNPEDNQINHFIDSIDNTNILALLFMYLMKIDKNSILNTPQSNMHSIHNIQKNTCDDPELD